MSIKLKPPTKLSFNTLQSAVMWIAFRPADFNVDSAVALAAELFGKSTEDILLRVAFLKGRMK